MSRPRLAGLLAVLALLATALVLGARGAQPAATPGLDARPAALSQELQQARVAAALPPCPQGVSTGLPALRLPCMAGGPDVDVSGAPGRPTLVNIWGTWCGPCVREVPLLVQFAATAGDRVAVLGVATEDSPASVYAFAKAVGVNYPQLRDDMGEVLRHFASYGAGVPKTVLVRADGSVAYVQVGELTSLAAVQAVVADHLGVRL